MLTDIQMVCQCLLLPYKAVCFPFRRSCFCTWNTFKDEVEKWFYRLLCKNLNWTLCKHWRHLQPWIFSVFHACVFRLQGSSIKTFNKTTCPSHLHAQSHNVTMELISVPSIHSLVLLFTRWPPSWFKSTDPCQRERQGERGCLPIYFSPAWWGGGAPIQPTLIQTYFFQQPIDQPLVRSPYETQASVHQPQSVTKLFRGL